MATHKRSKHRKQHGGLDWGKLLSKGLEIGKKVKDSGLISKGLNAASSIASALGKNDLAGKLGTAQGYAEAAGAGRKRKKKAGPKKVKRFAMKSPMQRAEVIQMDGANQESGTTGTGRKHRKRQQGGAWYDDLWGGIKSVASTALPIALQMAPMLMGAGRRGSGLNQAGGALSLAGKGYQHNNVVPNSIPNMKASQRFRPPRQLGSGNLSRCRRGQSVMVLS